MSVFDRYLSLWVALCIIAGVALGNLFPGLFQTVAAWEYASVNLVVAILIWAMVYPMMVAVDFASLRHVHKRPKGLVITVVVNWRIKPFTMAALGVLFFEFVFASGGSSRPLQRVTGSDGAIFNAGGTFRKRRHAGTSRDSGAKASSSSSARLERADIGLVGEGRRFNMTNHTNRWKALEAKDLSKGFGATILGAH